MSSQPEKDEDLVYHLVNPSTFDWRTELLPVLKKHSKLRRFEVVKPAEWLQRLEESEQDPIKNPSIKLVDFWRGKYGSSEVHTTSGDDEPKGLVFETYRTTQDCPSLGEVSDPVSEGLVERYVTNWVKGWLGV
jgi:hypothetical protein